MHYLDQQHLIAFLLGIARNCAWLALLVVIFVPLERLFARRPSKTLHKGVAADLGFFFISGLVPTLLLAVPLSLIAWGAHEVLPYRVQAFAAGLPFWARAAASLVVGEIGAYWGHRWTHEIPLLWRFHSVHHSPEHVYFLTSSHAHPIDNVFVRLCGFAPLYFLGLASPVSVSGNLIPTLIVIGTTIWGFFIHSNLRLRLGPLEWLISTPAFHHWHHTMTDHKDHNYAAMLPWVDRLFGTHYLPRHWPEAYGTETKLPTSLLGQLAHPFRRDEPEAQSAAGDLETITPPAG